MTEQILKIAAIPADGVGKEVVAAGRRVLDTLAAQSGGRFAFEWTEFPWGSEYYDKTGEMMDPDGLEILKPFDAVYFGAVDWHNVPDHISLRGLRLNITQNFDQIAVVERNDLTEPTPLFAEIHAVADDSDTDTANDPQRTASCLQQIGTHIGKRLINGEPTDRPVGENAALRTNMDLRAWRELRHFSSEVLTFRRQTG